MPECYVCPPLSSGIRSPGTGVTNGCEPRCGCWELNLRPLQGQQGLLRAEHLSIRIKSCLQCLMFRLGHRSDLSNIFFFLTETFKLLLVCLTARYIIIIYSDITMLMVLHCLRQNFFSRLQFFFSYKKNMLLGGKTAQQ